VSVDKIDALLHALKLGVEVNIFQMDFNRTIYLYNEKPVWILLRAKARAVLETAAAAVATLSARGSRCTVADWAEAVGTEEGYDELNGKEWEIPKLPTKVDDIGMDLTACVCGEVILITERVCFYLLSCRIRSLLPP